MDTYQGQLQAKGFKVGIVVSRYNNFVSERLLEGALDALTKLGASGTDISVFKVPGSFEIPFLVKKLARSKTVDGIICLGALIRGDTPHFDYLSAEVTKGIAQIAMDEGIPCAFGILTVETIEQGIERAGAKSGNKGWDAALSVVEMMNLVKTAKLG
ncbi:MAG: 6,7-dimethyl-8-ribityllumazine synthase [Candidatus Aminicenantales bacterium]